MAYTDQSFFAALKPFVLEDMRTSGILASLTAAQGYIESNKGNSGLTQKANNLFGIKGNYNGKSVKMQTTEYYNGVAVKVMADFRAYPSWQESIDDHSAMFNRMKRYENLRGLRDYQLACKYVQQDGYATSPTYCNTLLSVINRFQLYLWDAEVAGIAKGPVTVKQYPVLKRGSRGEYVLAWQKFLNQNGYFCGLEDGIFGKNTEAAVRQWQQAHSDVCGTADGIIGQKTWKSIGIEL